MIRCMPVLQVADVKGSETYYCDKLGFRTLGTWGDGPDFAIVQNGRVTIALDRSEQAGPLPTNQYWAAYIYVDNVDALHEQLRDNGADIVRAPENQPYGCRDFDIRDPDGHVLAFGQDLAADENGPGLASADAGA